MTELENPRNGLGWSNAIIGWPVLLCERQNKEKQERKKEEEETCFLFFSFFAFQLGKQSSTMENRN